MKTNTKILAILLFISVLGNILLVINPENASKVHNLTVEKKGTKSISLPLPSKPIIVKDYVFEVRDVKTYELIISSAGNTGNRLLVHELEIKNISKSPQTIRFDDFELVDEEENLYLTTLDYTHRSFDHFYNLKLNPGTSRDWVAVGFMVPDNPTKKYSLRTNKDNIKLTNSKGSKK